MFSIYHKILGISVYMVSMIDKFVEKIIPLATNHSVISYIIIIIRFVDRFPILLFHFLFSVIFVSFTCIKKKSMFYLSSQCPIDRDIDNRDQGQLFKTLLA